jgi:hypothetical protein
LAGVNLYDTIQLWSFPYFSLAQPGKALDNEKTRISDWSLNPTNFVQNRRLQEQHGEKT